MLFRSDVVVRFDLRSGVRRGLSTHPTPPRHRLCVTREDTNPMTTVTNFNKGYVFDNGWQHARERLSVLQAVFDPGTIRHLAHLNIQSGWNCLEVGAGAGSIAEWLCRTVGPRGRVLATDIDTRLLHTIDFPQLEV